MALLTQLHSLVREANDPWLTLYVINHLGDGVPERSYYSGSIQAHRTQLSQALLWMLWNPAQSRAQSIKERLKRVHLAGPHLAQFYQQAQQRASQLTHQRAQLAVRGFKMQVNVKLARESQQALQALLKEGLEGVAAKLKDNQTLTRWAAAMVAGRKRLHLEAELIDRLADPYPQVREAAREALTRLSRGNDFGPLPKATAPQIAQSAQAWRQWLALQDRPERIPEYLPRPQLAEADETPGGIREPLPRPKFAETEDAQP
jgi:hypothetical protein